MALYPDDPRGQRWFLGTILVAAVGALYFVYLYQPKQDELAELEDRVAQLEQQNRRAEARIGNLDELREEIRKTERTYRALRQLVPPRAEVPAVYESIAEQVESLGLELNRVSPDNPQPVEGSVYERQEWVMEVEAPYHTLGEFLTRVASFPRLVRPEVQEIRPASRTNTGDMPVVASLNLEMFVLPPDTASSGGGEGGES